jgi:hypothetical protein
LAVVCLIVSAGCKPAEQVTKYTAPRDPVDLDTISDEPDEGEAKVRILGAIAPAGRPGSWYFFKFQPAQMGQTYSPKALERHKADFDAFIRSLKFPPDGPPTWTLPAGWKPVEVRSSISTRLATFRMKKSETIVDLAVSEASGPLVDNINRWRVQQAGADPITEADIDTKCQVLTVDSRNVVIVDVSGPGGKGGMPPFAK